MRPTRRLGFVRRGRLTGVQSRRLLIAQGDCAGLAIPGQRTYAGCWLTIADPRPVQAAARVSVSSGAWLPELEPLSQNPQVTGRVSPTIIELVAAAAVGLAFARAVKGAVARSDASRCVAAVFAEKRVVLPVGRSGSAG